MIRKIKVESHDQVVTLASEVVYAQRNEWCNSMYRPLKFSLMRARRNFSYDKYETLPLLVYLCGGGFAEVDRNVWIPELVYFAKRGYAVASLEYSVTSLTRFPMQIEDIKSGIRFLRKHACQYGIDPDRILIMGESAGAYFSALAGVTSQVKDYDKGENLDISSSVNAVVCLYPPTKVNLKSLPSLDGNLPSDVTRYADIMSYITPKTPPFLILHGDNDNIVPLWHSELLYSALQGKGIESNLFVIEGANHADRHFFQDEVKKLIIDFLDKHLGSNKD